MVGYLRKPIAVGETQQGFLDRLYILVKPLPLGFIRLETCHCLRKPVRDHEQGRMLKVNNETHLEVMVAEMRKQAYDRIGIDTWST